MSSDVAMIAARYVRALFELAAEGKQHDNIKNDMLTIKALLSQSKELQKLITSPIISRIQAEQAMSVLLKGIKACDLTTRFFILLARERRLALSTAIIERYLTQLAESRGEVTIEVTAAGALTEDQMQVLSGTLAKATGKKVYMRARENPAIIGGVQVRIGSQMLDNSIATKLAKLRLSLVRAA